VILWVPALARGLLPAATLTARIDVAKGASGASVRVAGRLDESAARELWRLCLLQTGVLILDLEDLTSADPAALETLRGLRDRGCRIVGAWPYIRLLLDGAGGVLSDPDKEEK
jgi:hypothetical protein